MPHLQLAEVPLVEAQRACRFRIRDAQQVHHLQFDEAVSQVDSNRSAWVCDPT